jgi:hypothetical protein
VSEGGVNDGITLDHVVIAVSDFWPGTAEQAAALGDRVLPSGHDVDSRIAAVRLPPPRVTEQLLVSLTAHA